MAYFRLNKENQMKSNKRTKNTLLVLAVLFLSTNLFSKLKKDPNTFRYSSTPASNEINQNKYHELVWNCKDILKAYKDKHNRFLAQYPDAINSSAYDPDNLEGKNAVAEYLKRISTPTSIRLLKDLQEIKFNIV